MKRLLTPALLLFFHAATHAQTISGAVKDDAGKPAEKATVSLLNAVDSSIVKLDAAKADGTYQFETIGNGRYLIMASNVGFNTAYSAAFDYTGADIKLNELVLEKASTQLQGVVVTAKRPLVEVKPGRMVVNVEGTINATGNDGLELLRKSPGVLVDKDDNISMAGKNGVRIYIDGKPSPLTGADLASYLRSLQSSDIESIELITNPSAKYEAAGNAGIINIRLKKNKAFGTNGTITAGANVATYANYNGGFNINHRNKKVNLFGNYNYSQGLRFNKQYILRDVSDSLFDQHMISKSYSKAHNFKAGMDYFINDKNTIGIMVNGNISDVDRREPGDMPITYKPTNTVDRILYTNTQTLRDRSNYNGNLNYRYADTSGRELNVDLDYGYFNIDGNQYVPNIYRRASDGAEVNRNIYRIITATDIDLYSFKLDYEQPFFKGKLGYGGKLNFVNTGNDFKNYDANGSSESLDYGKSNYFKYKENVNALYVNYNRAYKTFSYQLGLRAENTNSDGISTGKQWDEASQTYKDYEGKVKRNYTDFFPSASITYNKNPMNQWSISYSRRIDRPDYDDLNPFEYRLNDYLYARGNTNLRPQYTNTIGITHTYKYKLNTSLNYSHVKDMFVQLIDTIDRTKSFQTNENLANQDVFSLNVSYPFTYKTYTFFSNLTANYSLYEANFGDGKVINTKNFNVQYFMQHSLKFGKTWTAELTGLYLSPFVWAGTFRGKSMGFISTGLQKTILKGDGTIKASVDDLFKTMRFTGDMNFAGAYTYVIAKWDSRQFKLNFTYKFGNKQVKSARQRKTGLDDESKRASGGGSSTPGQ
ncbi:TonB-dependent receptor [Niabella beijingensis]|uniref:TonB-dependent receptor n=1 Tax=Niabella beijingensis TaxID=2872700 RepID=UPI001CBDAA87|nr:TonB-dependent receptor [Niabella beijingensis]MBZ4189783.1 TonB-dependent receptor [Niabella beijingensis]